MTIERFHDIVVFVGLSFCIGYSWGYVQGAYACGNALVSFYLNQGVFIP